eukprot:2229044-Prymnesium_polylepis.1
MASASAACGDHLAQTITGGKVPLRHKKHDHRRLLDVHFKVVDALQVVDAAANEEQLSCVCTHRIGVVLHGHRLAIG